MKKILLSGAALLALSATSAQAEGLTLDLGGHFKGYGVYLDSDNDDLREFNIRKETEVHFTGETTLDNGLTVGVHVEADVDGDDDFATDEAYAYFSGGWGRVNFGEEDGAGYLLQVAAPSADSNVDGLRQYISASEVGVALDYDMAISGSANKVTYMTPVFNGFQAGASYTPTVGNDANGITATQADNDESSTLDDGYELALRYEGAFEGVGVAVGAGYSRYDLEQDGDAKAWNAGVDLDFAGFGIGVAYLDEDTDVTTGPIFGLVPVEVKTWVVGADYQIGAYKLGASWMNKEVEALGAEADGDRYTAGATYSYGPGMSFRGSVSYIDSNDADFDETQVLVGTQVNF